MKPDLATHISATYTTLRIGIAVLAIALPLVLWIGGYARAGVTLQESMSAYYHRGNDIVKDENGNDVVVDKPGNGVMRDVFVGVLCAVGAFLYLYKGFTPLENCALNLAGAFLVGVAFFPMEWGCGDSCKNFSWHGTFAILFFASIAYVCIFRAADTLDLLADPNKVKKYKKRYRLMGWGMIVLPLVAVVLTSALPLRSGARSTVFFVEAAGILVFASYWLLKSREIALSNSELAALQGELTTPPVQATDAFKKIPVTPKGQGAGGDRGPLREAPGASGLGGAVGVESN